MKRCTHCKQEKEDSEFYTSRVLKDGLQPWCKACMKALSKSRSRHGQRSFRMPAAESTSLVKQMLLDRGIPCCSGTSMSQNKVDLMAWACVPIEAKLARQSADNKFIFTFTKGQLTKLQGLVICVADFGDHIRTLVIPADKIKYSKKEKADRRGSLTVTFESFDLRSSWPDLMQYEDRFDLIEVERSKFRKSSDESSPFREVMSDPESSQ